MTLSTGTSVGSFEILGLLGVGGMGEVYRARDAKLGREVAIKVLPEFFAKDKDRLARFQREAKLLASLNHPNIASIYGLDEFDGMTFLEMELIEGTTLGERLALGAIPIDEALPLFSQMAEAIEFAHEHGVIHRDLKPENIKLTEDGKVKILDFGLAKALNDESSAPDAGGTLALELESAGQTSEGQILGTPAYMSPEQAQGKAVDKRTDIWGFGCCLYEALAGRRPFQGDSPAALLADILRGEPDWNTLPSDTPGRIRDLLWRCLQKNPRRRLRDIGDAWFEISESSASPSGSFDPPPTATPGSSRAPALLGWGIAAALALAWIFFVALESRRPDGVSQNVTSPPAGIAEPAPVPQPVRRYTLSLPDRYPVTAPILITDTLLDISQDGSMLVYVTDIDGIRRLVLRHRDSFRFELMPGTEGASSPFFSPDGAWIGFYVPGSRLLKKVSVRVGTVTTLCDATIPTGAIWREDGTIFFSSEVGGGIRQVSEFGDSTEFITELDSSRGDVYHVMPTLLPGGTHLIFLSSSGRTINDSRTEILSLETGDRKQIAEKTGRTVYLNSGHLLISREGGVVIRPFDLEKLEFTGPPIPANEDRIAFEGSIPSQFAYSAEGTFVYLPVSPGITAGNQLVWIDREGNETPANGPDGPHVALNLSPDGSQVVVGQDNMQDIWIFDLVGTSAPRRFTFDGSPDGFGTWSPAGDEIYFASLRTGNWRIHRQRLDGRGGTTLASSFEEMGDLGEVAPHSVDPTGQFLLFTTGRARGETGSDIGLLDLKDRSNSRILLGESFSEMTPEFSPDGKWIAYGSDETGNDEVFICSFPDLERKWQISSRGGTVPRWNPKGGEIFYKEANRMMVVKIDFEPEFKIGVPQSLFAGSWGLVGNSWNSSFYDVAPDGQRFLVIKSAALDSSGETLAPLNEINVIENWFEELAESAPTG